MKHGVIWSGYKISNADRDDILQVNYKINDLIFDIVIDKINNINKFQSSAKHTNHKRSSDFALPYSTDPCTFSGARIEEFEMEVIIRGFNSVCGRYGFVYDMYFPMLFHSDEQMLSECSKFGLNGSSAQILDDQEFPNHWVLVLQLVTVSENGSRTASLRLYDPFKPNSVENISVNLQKKIKHLYGEHSLLSLNVEQNIQQQNKDSDLCGHFVVAWLFDVLLTNCLPGQYKLDVKQMRSHLKNCVKKNDMKIFPRLPFEIDQPVCKEAAVCYFSKRKRNKRQETKGSFSVKRTDKQHKRENRRRERAKTQLPTTVKLWVNEG